MTPNDTKSAGKRVALKPYLRDTCLPALAAQSPYFSLKAVQAHLTAHAVPWRPAVLRIYLSAAMRDCLIYDAGRGWYSRLSDPVPLNPKPVAKLIRAIEKAFPLLDFTVWSTAQINPWMHHLLAHPITFLHAPEETLESLGDTLRVQGWEVAVNPPPSAGSKAFRPSEKMVVLRPTLSKQPPSHGRQDTVEKLLVDLVAESQRSSLMDQSEAEGVVREILSHYLVQLSELQSYAKLRKLKSSVFEEVNHLH